MAHDPRTFPEVSSQGIIIDMGKEAFMGVTAIYTESSPLVRDLEVERRNCIFADEKDVPDAKITVFKFYSQVNHLIVRCHFLSSFIRKTAFWNAEPESCCKSVDVCHITIQDWTPFLSINRGLRTWQPPVLWMVGSVWWTAWRFSRLWTRLSTMLTQTSVSSIL